MNIIVVLVIFMGCWVWGVVSMVRHHRAGRPSQGQIANENPQPVVSVAGRAWIESDTDQCRWTALDDTQLTRLLSEAAA